MPVNDKSAWIQTYSGRRFRPMAPRVEDVDIEDIAQALSNLCRFNGHCRSFYSVAQHSILVSELVPPDAAKAALLHDAAEAYFGDITRPVKEELYFFPPAPNSVLETVGVMEKKIAGVIFEAFGLEWPMMDSVTRLVQNADLKALATERRDLLRWTPDRWPCLEGVKAREQAIVVTSDPQLAKREFMGRFEYLFR